MIFAVLSRKSGMVRGYVCIVFNIKTELDVRKKCTHIFGLSKTVRKQQTATDCCWFFRKKENVKTRTKWQ